MIDNKLTNSAPTLTTLLLKPALLSGLLFTLLLMAISPKTLADATAIAEMDKLSNPAEAQIPNLSASSGKTASTRSSAPTETPAALASYYSTLQSYEAQGPYHQNASEVLYGLGLQLQKRGQHGKALKALRRAMHINRVNDGLNSLSQAPMLSGIINSQKHLAQFKPATTSYHQLLQLYIKNYGEEDPRLIPLLHELGQWHIDAYQFDRGQSRIDHLTSAYSFAISALQLNQTAPTINKAQQIELLRSTALINFFLSHHGGDDWSSSIDSQYSLTSQKLGTAGSQRTAVLTGGSFRRGRMCHERIIEILETDSHSLPIEKIKAHTELADWYLLFSHRNKAMQHYRHALDLIDSSDQPKILHNTHFFTPRLLPAIRMENIKGENGSVFINLELNISKMGRGDRIKTNGDTISPKDGPAIRRNLKHMIKQTLKQARFRPRFIGNNPVDANHVMVQIPLVH